MTIDLLVVQTLRSAQQTLRRALANAEPTLDSFDDAYQTIENMGLQTYAVSIRHPQKGVREKAAKVLEAINQAKAQLLGRKDIYEALLEMQMLQLDPEREAAVRIALQLFENAGVHLEEWQQTRLAEIETELEAMIPKFEEAIEIYAKANPISSQIATPQSLMPLLIAEEDPVARAQIVQIGRNNDHQTLFEMVYQARLLHRERATLLGMTETEFATTESLFDDYAEIAEFNTSFLRNMNRALVEALTRGGYKGQMTEAELTHWWYRNSTDQAENPLHDALIDVQALFEAAMDYYANGLGFSWEYIHAEGEIPVVELTYADGHTARMVMDIYPDAEKPDIHDRCMFWLGTSWIVGSYGLEWQNDRWYFPGLFKAETMLHEMGHAILWMGLTQSYFIARMEHGTEAVEVSSMLSEKIWRQLDPAILGLQVMPPAETIDVFMFARQAYLAVLVQMLGEADLANTPLEDVYLLAREQSVFEDDIYGVTLIHVLFLPPSYHMYTMGQPLVDALRGRELEIFRIMQNAPHVGRGVIDALGSTTAVVEAFFEQI